MVNHHFPMGFPAFSHRKPPTEVIEESLVEGILSTSARGGFYCLVNYIRSAFLYVHRDWATRKEKRWRFSRAKRTERWETRPARDFLFDLWEVLCLCISFLKENAEVHRFNGWIFGRRWYKIQLQQNMFREVSATGLGMENTEVAGCNKS